MALPGTPISVSEFGSDGAGEAWKFCFSSVCVAERRHLHGVPVRPSRQLLTAEFALTWTAPMHEIQAQFSHTMCLQLSGLFSSFTNRKTKRMHFLQFNFYGSIYYNKSF